MRCLLFGEARGQSLHPEAIWLSLCDVTILLWTRRVAMAEGHLSQHSSILRAKIHCLEQLETHPWIYHWLLPESVLVQFEFAFVKRHALAVTDCFD